MKKIFNVWKRKLHHLIERIKLSESDYLNMKVKSGMYNDMMSCVKCTFETEYEDIKNKEYIIARIPKTRTVIVNVDIRQMLANGGFVFEEKAVKLNIQK